MIHLLHPADQLSARVVETVMLLDRDLDTSFLAERGRIREHLGCVEVLRLLLESQIERILLTERVCVRDLPPRGGDGIRMKVRRDCVSMAAMLASGSRDSNKEDT
jgi:hypothetical protein